MIIRNEKPLMVIGYKESSITDEFLQVILKSNHCELIDPASFYSMTNKEKYQYIVSVIWDWAERIKIIEFLEKEKLDLFTAIDETCVLGDRPAPTIGAGSFINVNTIVNLRATVGKHCIISEQSIIGHYSSIGDNCYLGPGVMVVGKSTIGKNCFLGVRSTVLNKAKIVDNVKILPFSKIWKDIDKPGKYGRS